MSYQFNPFTNTFDIVGSGGSSTFGNPVATEADLPLTDADGSTRVVLASDRVYVFKLSTTKWYDSGLNLLAFSNTASSTGATLTTTTSGNVIKNDLTVTAADATHPGSVSTTTQTFAGNKTFAGSLSINTIDTPSSGTLALGTLNATTINIGNAGGTVNIQGTVITETTTTLNVTNPVITVNSGAGAGSASNSGIQVNENSIITGYAETSADRNSWILKAPNTAGIATVTPGAGGITLNQSSHDPLTLTAVGSSPNANGASLSTQALTLQPANGTNPGLITSGTQTIGGAKTFSSTISASNLSGTNTGDQTITLTGDITGSGTGSFATTLATVNSNVGSFGTASNVSTITVNGKGLITAANNTAIQITESQVTNLTTDLAAKQSTTLTNAHLLVGNGSNVATDVAVSGDVTLANTGAITLATVNSNVGSFGSTTAIPNITVNGKGLITAASTSAVVAPAGTLTGTTLASNVVTSSLTSVGTITSGIWTGTTIALANGGTGQTTKAPAFDALQPMTTGGDLIYGGASGTGTRLANGTAGQVLTSAGTTLAPAWATPTVAVTTTNSAGLFNLGLATSVASNAMTVALKQADGSTDPGSTTSAVTMNFRSSTALTGATITRTSTAATSVIISSGATLGATSNVENLIYVYALDNAGTIELGVSAALLDERTLTSSTAISGSATSGSILYSTTARTTVPIRLIGRIRQTQTTSGTYAAAATEVAVATLNVYKENEVEFTSTSTSADLVTNPAIGSWNQPASLAGLQVPPGTYDIFVEGTNVIINPTPSTSCLNVCQVGTSASAGASLLDSAQQIGPEARNGASPNTVPFNFGFFMKVKRQSFTTNTTLYVNQRLLTVTGTPVPTNSGFQLAATGNGVAVRLTAIRVGPP